MADWYDIDDETGLMERWAYLLDRRGQTTPSERRWEDWSDYGPLKLSPLRRRVEADTVIRFKELEVLDSVAESRFEPPPP